MSCMTPRDDDARLSAQLVFRVSETKRAQVEDLAAERDRSVGYVLRDAVDLLLERAGDREAVTA